MPPSRAHSSWARMTDILHGNPFWEGGPQKQAPARDRSGHRATIHGMRLRSLPYRRRAQRWKAQGPVARAGTRNAVIHPCASNTAGADAGQGDSLRRHGMNGALTVAPRRRPRAPGRP
ncbi:MAG: hypothetical protein OXU61_12240 [Gammaproteobacteria bacterium]|nr:hypothetical protein [Gammaproteobacteria bacterium]